MVGCLSLISRSTFGACTVLRFPFSSYSPPLLPAKEGFLFEFSLTAVDVCMFVPDQDELENIVAAIQWSFFLAEQVLFSPSLLVSCVSVFWGLSLCCLHLRLVAPPSMPGKGIHINAHVISVDRNTAHLELKQPPLLAESVPINTLFHLVPHLRSAISAPRSD